MRKRGRDGTFVQTVTPEAIPDVFEEVRGPMITTVDVADALDCSTKTARQKLGELSKDGTLKSRQAGRMAVWWPPESESKGNL